MDRGEQRELILSFVRKYRWAAAVVLVGLILMALPQPRQETQAPPAPEPAEAAGLQQQLEALLATLAGAGKVKVLLTEGTGEEVHYQLDQQEQRRQDSTDRRSDTVLVTGQDRGETGLVRRTDPPVYRGAVVLCQGADSPQVRLAVVDAVATATGLTSDKISVLKMK